MIRSVIPFRHWHAEWLVATGEPSNYAPPRSALIALESQHSYTGTINGEVMFCFGAIQQWPGRFQCWAMLSAKSGPHMRWITKAARKCMKHVPAGRMEATVRADFPQGQRWMEMLGFEVETPRLRAYGPEGEDHIGFVRMN